MINIKDWEEELQNNEQLKEQWIPRKWKLLSADFRKEKRQQLLNLLFWTKGVNFWYENVASNSEYSKTWVKKLYSDRRFRWVIADFKHMRDVQYVTDETVEKIISVISAIRSIEGKYSESIIKTLTANDENKTEWTKKKEPVQLEIDFDDGNFDTANPKENNNTTKRSEEQQKQLDELYDDTNTKYEHRWQEYNNK